MAKILTMFFRNYGSFFGEHVFQFADRGTVLLTGRNLDEPRMKSNGAGKSTVCDALEWCLFGEVPRNDTADSIVNEEAGKDCSTTVQIAADDGALIQVQRTRGVKKQKDGPRLWVNGHEKTKLDSDETQRDIERVIGLDREVFRAAVYFPQRTDFDFARATDAERKRILTKILQLGDIDRYAEILDARASKVEAERARLASQRALHEQGAAALARDIEHAGAMADAWEAGRASRQQQVDAYAGQMHAQVQALSAELAGLVPAAQPAPATPFVSPTADALSALSGKKAEVAGALHFERQRYVATKKELEAFDALAHSGTCPHCKQPLSPQHRDAERGRLAGVLVTVEERGKALAAEEERLKAEGELLKTQGNAAWEAYQQSQAARSHAIAEANAYAQKRAALERSLYLAQQGANSAEAERSRVASEQNPHGAQVATLRARYAEESKRVEETAVALASAEEASALLAFWKSGFGPKGVKSYVLDSRIEEMTSETNRWIQLLTGGTCWVRFETQKEVGTGSKKKLSETFTIRCFRHNPDGTITERNFESWSGGEEDRIACGINFGLARLVAQRSRSSYDLLILDEIFQKSLDSAGKEAVAEMLSVLAAEKSTIIVVDHDVIFQGFFQQQIVVEKKFRKSRIVE